MDITVFKIINFLSWRFAFLDWLGVFLAKYLPYFIVLIFLVFVFLKIGTKIQKFYFLIFSVLTILLSRGIGVELIRFFYNRPRPFEVLDLKPLFLNNLPSFPSGHAAFLFALSFAVFYFNRRWGLILMILSFLNGLARIFSGIHWPSDILGGILIAFLSFLLILLILKPLKSIKKDISQ